MSEATAIHTTRIGDEDQSTARIYFPSGFVYGFPDQTLAERVWANMPRHQAAVYMYPGCLVGELPWDTKEQS